MRRLATLAALAMLAPLAANAGEHAPFPRGVWASEGYGWIFDARGDDGASTYHHSRAGCWSNTDADVDAIPRTLTDLRLGPGGGAFEAGTSENVTRFRFTKIADVPVACLKESARDPHAVFDAFWTHFDEHYAFFAERGVDWSAMGRHYREQVTPEMSASDLFAVLAAMIRPLEDVHVVLNAEGVGYAVSGLDRFGQVQEAAYLHAPPDGEFWSRYRARQAPLKALTEKSLIAPAQRGASGLVSWGWLPDKIGYLRVDRFRKFSSEPTYAAQEKALREALDLAFAEVGAAPALVLDLRFNTGGYDGLALHLAGRFVDRDGVGFVKSARSGSGWTAAQPLMLKPTGASPYRAPLVVLTSAMTASAAENFLLALRDRRAFTQIGERTARVHADELAKPLPNGWTVTISNERFVSADGVLYEAKGFVPDAPVEYLAPIMAGAKHDPVVAAARQHLSIYRAD